MGQQQNLSARGATEPGLGEQVQLRLTGFKILAEEPAAKPAGRSLTLGAVVAVPCVVLEAYPRAPTRLGGCRRA